MVIFDFNKQSVLDWVVVDDAVMGGRSSGYLDLSDHGHAVFHGEVSLENNGGFTSIRYRFDQKKIDGFEKISIKLRGDGKSYKFRIKEHINDRHSYMHIFSTTGDWQTIEIEMAEMMPWYRGRKLNMPAFSASLLAEVAFLIANKQEESFRLEIDTIVLE